MDWQTVINFALGSFLAALGWFAREIWDAIKELRKDIKAIEKDLPDHYVRRDDFRDALQSMHKDMGNLKDDMRENFRKLETLIGGVFKRLDEKVSRDEIDR